MKILVKRVALIFMILAVCGFCLFFENKKIVSSALCLVGGILLFNGLTEKDFRLETYIIMGLGVIIAVITLFMGENSYINIYTTFPPN